MTKSAQAILGSGIKSVTILTPWFPNQPGDHNGAFVYDSAAALAKTEIAVAVLVCRPWVPPVPQRFVPRWTRGTLQTKAFGDTLNVELVRYPSLAVENLRLARDWAVQRIVAPRLRSIIEKTSSQLIHVHTEGWAPIGVAVGKQLGLPVVVTVHGLDANLSRRAYLGHALAAADRVILVGEPLRSVLRGFIGSEDHFRIAHNGVVLPAEPRSRAILTEGKQIDFISVSNLHEGKGIDISLDALAIARDRGFKNWRYKIIGEGSERQALARLTKKLGLENRVEFLGGQPHQRIFDFLNEADVFILPSYREAFGIAYLEAMAAGLLTIGVQGQGPEAFIENNKTGLLVEPNDPHALADLILKIENERLKMREIAAAGAQRARASFTWAAHAGCLVGIYKELVA